MRITVLAGGVGGAKFLLGVREFATRHGGEVTAIVNTGDDVTLHGLRICPDLDSVMYTLGDGADTERGWGQKGETWRVNEALATYGTDSTWFSLGDLDLATHLVRTQMLDAGYPLAAVTAALCQRWQPGITLLPMTDQRCETHVVVESADADSGRRVMHFQEWWVRHRAALPAQAFVQVGVENALPGAGVLEAIAEADLILFAPSNPVVSVNTILSVPGLRPALQAAAAPIVGVSPIIGGAPVRGMAEKCLPVLGVEVSGEGVGQFYGGRGAGGLLDGWIVHTDEKATIDGAWTLSRDIIMHDPAATAGMVEHALSQLENSA